MPFPNRRLCTSRPEEDPEAGSPRRRTSERGSVAGAQILSTKCLVRFDPIYVERGSSFVGLELPFKGMLPDLATIKEKKRASSPSYVVFSSLEDI